MRRLCRLLAAQLSFFSPIRQSSAALPWVKSTVSAPNKNHVVDASHEKPPPRPPDKERPAPVVRTSNRPLVQASFKTSASNYSRDHDGTKACARAEAEALFKSVPHDRAA